MEFSVANIIQLVVIIAGVGVAWGDLNTKYKNLSEQKKTCDKRFEVIDARHNNAIDGIQLEMKAVSASLNQLIGRIDAMFSRQEQSKQ